MVDEMWRCKDHGKHCKGIQYLEKSQDLLIEKLEKIEDNAKQCEKDRINETKDCRNSTRQDNEKLEDHIKKYYVSKEEIKTMYILLIAVALDAIRRLFT